MNLDDEGWLECTCSPSKRDMRRGWEEEGMGKGRERGEEGEAMEGSSVDCCSAERDWISGGEVGQ